MGVSGALARLAAARAHVLLVEIPGHPVLRMRVEAAVATRGWVLAAAPADADVLLVCGEATAPFTAPLEAVWEQLPSPRYRCTVAGPGAVDAVLDTVPAALCDLSARRDDARTRTLRVGDQSEATGGQDMGDMDMGGMDMDMSGPAGIPLAGGDESDRDGLEMDVTHLTLGPILPDWPAGLVACCTLHGDVVGDVTLEVLPGRDTTGTGREPGAEAPGTGTGGGHGTEDPDPGPGPSAEAEAVTRAARLCDAAARLLAVAGWDPVALKLRRIRDDLLGGVPPGASRDRLLRSTRRIARSRTLRWSLAGIPAAGGTGAHARLLGRLRGAAALLSGEPGPPREHEWPETLDDVRRALIGQELTTVRLTVASIDPARFATLAGPARG